MKEAGLRSKLPEMKINRFLVLAALFGFSIELASAQVLPGAVTTAPSVAPAPVHRPVKRRPVQPVGTVKLHRGNTGLTGQNSHPQVQAVHPRVQPVHPPVINYAEAFRRHHRERHDRSWWRSHYPTIVFVSSGYYYWDAGYWFPAWGYDPLYDNYDYEGPIYTYGNLLPDQVIINVQRALQQLGYYAGALTGSLGPATRAAISAYQQDAGLIVTGAIDGPTVEALGLY
jgi:hypothetical protein